MDALVPSASTAPESRLLVYNVSKAANVGPILRSACAFGVSECVVVGSAHFKTFGSQGTATKLRTRHHAHLRDAVAALHDEGFAIVGVEITPDARPLDEVRFGPRTCFLFGNEGAGLIPAAMAVCDSFVYIRQFGQKTASLNVAVAAGIVLHHWALWAGLHEAQREGFKYVVSDKQPVLLGTYTTTQGHVTGTGKGVYRCQVSPHTGLLTDLELVVECRDPSWISLAHAGDTGQEMAVLLAVQESCSGDRLVSWQLDKSQLSVVTRPDSPLHVCPMSDAPCHIDVAPGGLAVVSNYMGDTRAVRVREDASLELVATVETPAPPSRVDVQRQSVAHPHFFVAVSETLGLGCDLGCDVVVAYALPLLQPLSPPLRVAGGPRHLAVHPTLARCVYVVSELSCELRRFNFAVVDGVVQWTASEAWSTLPRDLSAYQGRTPSVSAVRVHPQGHLLFVANRFHDSLSVFELDAHTGDATLVQNIGCGGKTTRDMALLPDGAGLLLVANQDSSNVACFALHGNQLRPTGQRFPVPSPTCIVFP